MYYAINTYFQLAANILYLNTSGIFQFRELVKIPSCLQFPFLSSPSYFYYLFSFRLSSLFSDKTILLISFTSSTVHATLQSQRARSVINHLSDREGCRVQIEMADVIMHNTIKIYLYQCRGLARNLSEFNT